MSKTLRVGAGIVALYVVVCAATIGLSTHHVRPLFEGIGPAAPYEWVKPPPLFAPGNVTPTSSSTDIPFTAMANAVQVGTGDAQFMVNIPAHGVTPHPGASSTRFVLTPGDPLKLGPLPPGFRPAGNAYRAEFTYEPGGADASPLATPGNVTLIVPEPVKAILYSADGRTWDSLPAQMLANVTTVGTTFRAAGWYLGGADAATSPPGGLAGKPSSGKKISTLLIVGLVIVIVVALVGVPSLLRRRHRRGPPAKPAPIPGGGASPRPRSRPAGAPKRKRK